MTKIISKKQMQRVVEQFQTLYELYEYVGEANIGSTIDYVHPNDLSVLSELSKSQNKTSINFYFRANKLLSKLSEQFPDSEIDRNFAFFGLVYNAEEIAEAI